MATEAKPTQKAPAGWRRIPRADCPHWSSSLAEATSEIAQCETCGLAQDLRICLTCGFVGCCESHGAHDTQHFKETRHPFIRPHRNEADWLWCYECSAFLQ